MAISIMALVFRQSVGNIKASVFREASASWNQYSGSC
jgi:hypothetical protein